MCTHYFLDCFRTVLVLQALAQFRPTNLAVFNWIFFIFVKITKPSLLVHSVLNLIPLLLKQELKVKIPTMDGIVTKLRMR